MPSQVRIVLEEFAHKEGLKRIQEAIEFAKVQIDSRTPEDTGKLIKKNKLKPARLIGTTIIASVENDSEYAAHVEYGINQKSMNYHKYRTRGKRKKADTLRDIIRTGVGARMYSLTKDIDGKKIVEIATR